MGGTGLTAKGLGFCLELSTCAIKKRQVSLPRTWLNPPHKDSSQPRILGREVSSEIQRESETVPHYAGRARKNRKKKKKSLLHMGKAANQDNRLMGTDEGEPRHHNNKLNDSERRNFCVSFHLPFFSIPSLSFPAPGGRQLVSFSLPPTSCLVWGVQLLREGRRTGLPERCSEDSDSVFLPPWSKPGSLQLAHET